MGAKREECLSHFLLCVVIDFSIKNFGTDRASNPSRLHGSLPCHPGATCTCSPAVQQAITVLAPANNPPLCAIFHGDPLPFPVIAAVLSAIVPPPVAADTAPAEEQSERAPCRERTLAEKLVHPLQQVQPSLLLQPTLHHNGTLIKREPFLN